jgi:hypothetical protein
MRRDVVISNEYALPLTDLFYKVSVAAENPQWYLQRNVTYGLRGRQAGGHVIISTDDARDPGDAAQETQAHHHD